jgi:hypothetical protein
MPWLASSNMNVSDITMMTRPGSQGNLIIKRPKIGVRLP